MASPRKKKFTLAALLVALVAAGALLPLSHHLRERQDSSVAVAPVPAPQEPVETAPPPPPPGAEVVPPEEAETDRGPASATPSGPTLSFARAAGLHLAADPLRLNSSAALLVNQDSGEVLVRKNDQAVLPIASLTKLMTALIVLEANQPMDEVLTITEEDVDTERHSRSRLRVGSTLTRKEALHLALMSSENRAAHALGRTYPGGIAKAVEAMNARARQLGMKSTTYVDPTGLSNRNQSTARDVAVLVSAASRQPVVREFSTTSAHVADLGGRTLQYINSNRLVRNQRAGWDIELQKTGYIVEAGRCLTMLTEVGGRNLILVLLDAESNGARLNDAERMRRYVSAQWGLPDVSVAAKKEAPRKVAARSPKKDADEKRKTVVAKKEPAKASSKKEKAGSTKKASEKTQVAKKKESAKTDTEKKEASSGGRVRQTYAAGRSEQKS